MKRMLNVEQIVKANDAVKKLKGEIVRESMPAEHVAAKVEEVVGFSVNPGMARRLMAQNGITVQASVEAS